MDTSSLSKQYPEATTNRKFAAFILDLPFLVLIIFIGLIISVGPFIGMDGGGSDITEKILKVFLFFFTGSLLIGYFSGMRRSRLRSTIGMYLLRINIANSDAGRRVIFREDESPHYGKLFLGLFLNAFLMLLLTVVTVIYYAKIIFEFTKKIPTLFPFLVPTYAQGDDPYRQYIGFMDTFLGNIIVILLSVLAGIGWYVILRIINTIIFKQSQS